MTTVASPPPAVRVGLFLVLGALASLQLATLVPGGGAEGRILLSVAVAACGAFVLARSGTLELSRPAALAVRAGVTAATALGCLAAAGVPGALLRPWGLEALADGLERGLEGIRTVRWPYRGGDPWVTRTVLLPAPLALTAAAALCFWPARRAAGALRAAGAAVLVGLFAVAIVEHDPGGGAVRGLVLLLALVAWAALGSTRARDAGPALLTTGAAGLAAVVVGLALDPARPWLEYRTWESDATGARFDWDHRYGPIDWPRTGTTLLQIGAPRPYYWKAETLDAFDGTRWRRSGAAAVAAARFEVPRDPERAWFERVRVTVRSLRSELLVGAGTTLGSSGVGATRRSPDGTTTLTGEPLEEGDAYTIAAYVPDPSVERMRQVSAAFPPEMRAYTSLALPPDVTRRRAGRMSVATSTGLRGDPRGLDPSVRRELLASPYAPVARLAARLAPPRLSTYDAVRSIEGHLRGQYRYLEGPPPRRYPLAAFLTEDRAGYCQQFSGAMALMLRMRGIPARVAAGFSPGAFDRDAREHRVRDTDAHSWVEVFFPGIGWVPFDPTPSAAPAEAQGDQALSGSAARDGLSAANPDPARTDGGAGETGPAGDAPEARGSAVPARGGGPAWLLVAGAVLGIGALGTAMASRALARRRAVAGLDPELRELGAALKRLEGVPPGGTTLAELERRFESEDRRAAARYVRALRYRRFAPAAPAGGPTRADRRGLRRDLGRRRTLARNLLPWTRNRPSTG